MTTIFIRDQNGKAYTIPKPFEIVTTPGEPTYHGFVELVKWGAPRQTFRPWTAKEWGARIGDKFVLNGTNVTLVAVAPTTLCFEGDSEHFPLPGQQYAAQQDDKGITQLDGQPCGTYEEISQ